jgi:hypothetical protein
MFQEYMYSREDFSKTLIDLCSIMATFPNLNVLNLIPIQAQIGEPKISDMVSSGRIPKLDIAKILCGERVGTHA